MRRLLKLMLAIACAAGFMASFAAPTAAREVVAMSGPPGLIIVRTHQRRLYFLLGHNRAIRYPVGVGRAGMRWYGRAHVEGMYLTPAWAPPPSIKRENPRIPDYIPGGARNNPMGAAALTLNDGTYAIHGTDRPSSVGRFVSHGCIRMYNRDILDLFDRVHVGTPVLVMR